jgi:hypothetical protein
VARSIGKTSREVAKDFYDKMAWITLRHALSEKESKVRGAEFGGAEFGGAAWSHCTAAQHRRFGQGGACREEAEVDRPSTL